MSEWMNDKKDSAKQRTSILLHARRLLISEQLHFLNIHIFSVCAYICVRLYIGIIVRVCIGLRTIAAHICSLYKEKQIMDNKQIRLIAKLF